MAEIVIILLFPEEDEEWEGIMRITRKRLNNGIIYLFIYFDYPNKISFCLKYEKI